MNRDNQLPVTIIDVVNIFRGTLFCRRRQKYSLSITVLRWLAYILLLRGSYVYLWSEGWEWQNEWRRERKRRQLSLELLPSLPSLSLPPLTWEQNRRNTEKAHRVFTEGERAEGKAPPTVIPCMDYPTRNRISSNSCLSVVLEHHFLWLVLTFSLFQPVFFHWRILYFRVHFIVASQRESAWKRYNRKEESCIVTWNTQGQGILWMMKLYAEKWMNSRLMLLYLIQARK